MEPLVPHRNKQGNYSAFRWQAPKKDWIYLDALHKHETVQKEITEWHQALKAERLATARKMRDDYKKRMSLQELRIKRDNWKNTPVKPEFFWDEDKQSWEYTPGTHLRISQYFGTVPSLLFIKPGTTTAELG